MKTTVVIPSFNDGNTISTTLKAVLAGEQLPDEILVCDGGSQDNTLTELRQFPVRVLHNRKKHAAGARNLGIEAAHGDVIAFTDSDCVPDIQWLSGIHAEFQQTAELDGVGGRVFALPPENDIEKFAAQVLLNGILRYSNERQYVTQRGLAGAFITANCAYTREALIKVGGFRDECSNYGEDIDLFWRFIEARANLVYNPDVLVYHSYPRTRKQLASKYIRYGIASSALTHYHLRSPHIDWGIHYKLWTNILYLILGRNRRESSLFCIQLGSHVIGKILGSVRYRVVNL